MMSGGGSLHKKDWLKIGGGVAAAAALPFAFPEIAAAMGIGGATGAAGLAGAEGAAGLGAGGTAGLFGATPGLASSMLAGAAPAALAAPEAAGIGGGSAAALFGSAAAPEAGLASGLLSTPTAQASLANPSLMDMFRAFKVSDTGQTLGSIGKAANYAKTAQTGMGLLSPQSGNSTTSVSPHGQAAPVGNVGAQPDSPPPYPYSPADPVWQAYLKRHPELGRSYG